jgi:hypothetical protein
VTGGKWTRTTCSGDPVLSLCQLHYILSARIAKFALRQRAEAAVWIWGESEVMVDNVGEKSGHKSIQGLDSSLSPVPNCALAVPSRQFV